MAKKPSKHPGFKKAAAKLPDGSGFFTAMVPTPKAKKPGKKGGKK